MGGRLIGRVDSSEGVKLLIFSCRFFFRVTRNTLSSCKTEHATSKWLAGSSARWHGGNRTWRRQSHESSSSKSLRSYVFLSGTTANSRQKRIGKASSGYTYRDNVGLYFLHFSTAPSLATRSEFYASFVRSDTLIRLVSSRSGFVSPALHAILMHPC